MSRGIELIAAERERQVTEEGWTPEHDARHKSGAMSFAAATYALPEYARAYNLPFVSTRRTAVPLSWPWSPIWWKPSPDDRVRELVKAGALIAAEIDRITVEHAGR